MTGSDWFLNLIYVVYVAAPMLKDELWLRTLLVINAIGFIVWGGLIENGSVMFWNALFGLVSVLAIIRLLRERRVIELHDDLETVKQHLLPSLTNREFLTFWGMGRTWETDSELTVQGEDVSDLMFILEGEAAVRNDGAEIARVGSMDFVGEMSFVSGEPASATVSPLGTMKIHSWDRSDLEMLSELEPKVVEPLLTGINRDLVGKVRRANRREV